MFDYRLIQRPKNICYVVDPVSTTVATATGNPWLAPLIGGTLGALGGLFGGGGGDQTTTQTVMPPQMTGQQQIMANQLANWLYQAMPQYQNYINQTLSAIYGGQPGAPTVGGAAPVNVPGQLSGEMKETTEENISKEAQYQRDLESYNIAKDLIRAFEIKQMLEYGPMTEYPIAAQKELKTILDKSGLNDIAINEYYKQWKLDPEGFTQDWVGPKPLSDEEKAQIVKDYEETHRVGRPIPKAQEAIDKGLITEQDWKYAIATGQDVDALVNKAAATEGYQYDTTTEKFTEAPEGYSPFKEFMSWDQDKIASYFGTEREKVAKEIDDWQSQAMREMEQRGISQRGGFLGSGTEKDISRLLGEAGQLSTGMNWNINQAEQAMKMNQPLQQLEMAYSALQGLQGMQAPWMQLGGGLIQPYGATTSVTTQPGASTGQNILGGALSGLGIAGMGQGLGWWSSGKPATNLAYGMAGQSANPWANPYPLRLAGTQNLWNTNPWSLG